MNEIVIPTLRKPVTAKVAVPGSKSYTNRALLLAAMTPGKVDIRGALESEDTEAMMDCLRTLGINISRQEGTITVHNDVSKLPPKDTTLDVNLSGLTMRFLLALSCIIPGVQTLHGKEGLNKRPIGELADGLRQLGADIEYLEWEGFPPVRVHSNRLKPGTVRMQGDVSSQYFSALLQIAPLVGNVTIEVLGEQISKPYIDMTIDTMRTFGVRVQNDEYRRYTVTDGQRYSASSYTVEGDVSSACYFWAVAALTNSTIEVTNLNPQSKQADMRFLNILREMGSSVTAGGNSITVTGAGVRAVTTDMEDCPDQAMTVAALAAFTPGITVLKGVQTLRVKETERVAAVEQELVKMGIKTSSTKDTLTVHGGRPHAATINTYGDHRMAMSFAVAATKLAGMRIADPSVVGKTFPGFWDSLFSVLAAGHTGNITLIGLRGTGKSTVGKLLAARLNRPFIDLDERIVATAGQTVPEIVAEHGWEYFRSLESAQVRQAAKNTGQIIAAGGGAILRPENAAAFKRTGICVLLTAATATLAERIGTDPNRPALTTQNSLQDELDQLWRDRRAAYEAAADITVDTDERSVADIANNILHKLAEGIW